MANVNNSCISCERVGFCHHREVFCLTVVTKTSKWSSTQARIIQVKLEKFVYNAKVHEFQ